MKKTRYYPFERNRYFYGKLLTVRDFESEQKYFNDKRRLLNRLLHGAGVIAGMQVVAVDDKAISVEMGAALDYAGREIIIPAPVTLKLSMLDGFTNNEYKKNVYLYVDYDEKGKEPVHSIANSTIRSEEVSEYNRVFESYRLFIREEAPEPTTLEHIELTQSIASIYQDQNIRIYQRMPRYVNPDELVEVTVVIEKTLQTPPISFEFDFQADGFHALHGNKVSFSEPGDGRETEYTFTYAVKAANRPGTTGEIKVNASTAKLTVGDQRIALHTQPANQVEIISEQVNNRIIDAYYKRTLDQAVDGSSAQSICLAKISLLQMGPTYMIERIDQVPFGEYIYNPSMLQKLGVAGGGGGSSRFWAKAAAYGLEYDQEPELSVDYNAERNEFTFNMGVPKPQLINDEISTGVFEFAVDPNAKTSFFSRGQRNHVSDELQHGLGKGQVFITIGMEEHHIGDTARDSGEQVFYGSPDVFKGSPYEPDLLSATFGTVVYPSRGSFRIGMRVNQDTELSRIKVRWWAFKKLPSARGEAALAAAAAAEQVKAVLEAAADEE